VYSTVYIEYAGLYAAICTENAVTVYAETYIKYAETCMKYASDMQIYMQTLYILQSMQTIC
jgi:hypothetical protein